MRGQDAMMPQLRPIREWHDVDARVFRDDIVPLYSPAVLRGVIGQWPAVARARTSPDALSRYLAGFDRGAPVDLLVMPPNIRGRLFYNDDMSGFNFTRSKAPIGEISDKVLRYAKFERRPAIVAQSALIADCLPGFQ